MTKHLAWLIPFVTFLACETFTPKDVTDIANMGTELAHCQVVAHEAHDAYDAGPDATTDKAAGADHAAVTAYADCKKDSGL